MAHAGRRDDAGRGGAGGLRGGRQRHGYGEPDGESQLNESASEGQNDVGTMLDLTNSSRHACALDGYPGLGLLDSRHRVLRTVTHQGDTFWTNDTGRRIVGLAPGQTAYAGLAWTHTGDNAVSASYLEVTPPNSTTHLTISFRQLVDGGDLDVTALTGTVSFSNGI